MIFVKPARARIWLAVNRLVADVRDHPFIHRVQLDVNSVEVVLNILPHFAKVATKFLFWSLGHFG